MLSLSDLKAVWPRTNDSLRLSLRIPSGLGRLRHRHLGDVVTFEKEAASLQFVTSPPHSRSIAGAWQTVVRQVPCQAEEEHDKREV